MSWPLVSADSGLCKLSPAVAHRCQLFPADVMPAVFSFFQPASAVFNCCLMLPVICLAG